MSYQDIESGHRVGYVSDNKDDPSQALASRIFQINTAVATFQRIVNALGTLKDTPQLREKLHETRLHIGQLVKDTSAKLKQASETDHRVAVSASKKITDAKLAKDFQAALKEFQKAQQLAAQRETTYTPLVQQPHRASSYTTGVSAPDKSQKLQALVAESRSREGVSSLDNELSFNEAVIEDRDREIRDIQQQIGEINGIFKDLAVLLHDDRFTIGDIGSQIENAHAKSQRDEAVKARRSKSSLICWLLVVFGIVLLIVIIILAV